MWYETAQRADKAGPYDGKMGVNQGNGKWWDGYDPQELYAQNHPLSKKGDTLYAIALGWPGEKGTVIKSLATTSPQLSGRKISDVSLLGYNGKLAWSQTEEGLKVKMPVEQPCKHAVALKISGAVV